MRRILTILAIVTFATPALAADTCETVTVHYESTYVKAVQQRLRSQQAARRAKLHALRAKRVTVAPTAQAELLRRALALPVSSQSESVALK